MASGLEFVGSESAIFTVFCLGGGGGGGGAGVKVWYNPMH